MRFVTEITVPNTQYERLRADRDQMEEYRAEQMREVEELEGALHILLQATPDTVSSLRDATVSWFTHTMIGMLEFPDTFDTSADRSVSRLRGIFQSEIFNVMSSRVERILDIKNRLQHRRNEFQAYVNDSTNRLTHLREQMEGLSPEPTVYRAADIQAQLDEVEFILPGSVSLTDERYVTWIQKPVLASVTGFDTSDKPWFHFDTQFIKIPIPAMEIKVNLESRQISVEAIDNSLCAFTWNHTPTPHPHILSYGQPCLGDFGGPIMEAIDSNDWNTVSTLIRLFFEQINHQDAAGKQWPAYFRTLDRRVTLARMVSRRSAAESRILDGFNGPWEHFFYEDGRWVIRKSTDPHNYVAVNDSFTEAVREEVRGMEGTFTIMDDAATDEVLTAEHVRRAQTLLADAPAITPEYVERLGQALQEMHQGVEVRFDIP